MHLDGFSYHGPAKVVDIVKHFFALVDTVLGISLYSWTHSSLGSKHGCQLQFGHTL